MDKVEMDRAEKDRVEMDRDEQGRKGLGRARLNSRADGPAPVVPSLRFDVRRPRDCRMVMSLPPTVMSTSAAWASMKPSD